MFVEAIRLTSFSSWEDSTWLELAPDLNLFIGLNNSGKSALLRSFLYPLPHNPHKDSDNFLPGNLKDSKVELKICISVKELFERFARIGSVPTFPAGASFNPNPGTSALEELINDENALLTLECERRYQYSISPVNGGSIKELRSPNPLTLNVERVENAYKAVSRASDPDNLPTFFDVQNSESIFYFSAQRLNVARYAMQEQTRLAPDASNLPAVLAYVQGARTPLFQEIEAHVTEIMSGVERITVAPRGQNFEILVWPVRDTIHPELAFSLDDSGTGVGQLLAILTAVVLSEQSVIVIDEINTFLHASAVKKLLALLKTTYSRHQYVISSHSAEVIGAADPSLLYHVTRDAYKSTATRLSLSDVRQAREIAGNFGFSMLDVFGFERIIWVEGQTEELIFPLILEKCGTGPTAELGFCAVASTSAFSSRGGNRTQVLEIYENAGRRLAPLLKGMAFGLDREGMDDEAVKILQRSRRKLRFLPRRCVENYFIKPDAIAEVMNSLGENVTADDVEMLINRIGGDKALLAPSAWTGQITSFDWLVRVDGAKLLSTIFSELSENRLEFRKTRDSVSLTKSLIASGDSDLDSLTSFVRELREIAMRDSPP